MNEITLPQLQERIAEISAILDEVKAGGLKLNEADTEHKVIDPLLHALGYGPLDIQKRGHDSVAHNFPDYTLLPNKHEKWFLEVKRLDLPLQDGEAAQAVNYANNQGAEWAVLTNGRRWYIYNAHLPKPLTEKRVFQINDLFGDDSALKTLEFLSRSSMLAGGLTEAWAFGQVQALVKAQLETPHSTVRKQLRKLASEETKTPVTDELIERALRALSPALPPVPDNGTEPKPLPSPKPPLPRVDGGQTLYTYADIIADYNGFNNKQPQALYLGNDTPIPVKSWTQANEMATNYLCTHYILPPLPLTSLGAPSTAIINTTPIHPNGTPMKAHHTLQVGDKTIYIYTYLTIYSRKRYVAQLLIAVGAPQDAVRVSIR